MRTEPLGELAFRAVAAQAERLARGDEAPDGAPHRRLLILAASQPEDEGSRVQMHQDGVLPLRVLENDVRELVILGLARQVIKVPLGELVHLHGLRAGDVVARIDVQV